MKISCLSMKNKLICFYYYGFIVIYSITCGVLTYLIIIIEHCKLLKVLAEMDIQSLQ